jgi:hypothetical protein
VVERKVKDYAREAVFARTGRDVPELLRELYIGRRHTQEEIADALEVSRGVVRDWLVEFDIHRKDRPAVAL